MADKENRRSDHLFKTTLPILLRKPPSKWTKDEIWNAVWLYFHPPKGGLLLIGGPLRDLEDRLMGRSRKERIPSRNPRGRTPRFTRERYEYFARRGEEIRREIASEKGIPPVRVPDALVAKVLANMRAKNRGKAIPNLYTVKRWEDEYKTFFKGLKKKVKSGEINILPGR